jgi:hypothetical protein
MIEDPRTDWGHRNRSFALDKPAPLFVSKSPSRASFALPALDGHSTQFTRDQVALGFEVTVRDGPDSKVVVKLVPLARYRDERQLIPAEGSERDQATETFPGTGIEVLLSATEFLVIGTDSYREGTFGHAAFTGPKEDRTVQRLLVLRATRTKPERDAAVGPSTQAVAPPLASQATAARGVSP